MKILSILIVYVLVFGPVAQASNEVEQGFDPSAEAMFEVVADSPGSVTAPVEGGQTQQEEYPCTVRGDCYLDTSVNLPASGIVPVKNVQRLPLLGKGLMGKHRKQYLGIACVGDQGSCSVLRYVYQVNPQEVYFMGPKFQLNPNYKGGNKKAIKKAVKALYDEASDSGQRGLKIFAGALIAAFGAVFLFQVTWPAIALFTIGAAKGLGGGQRWAGISAFPAFDASGNLRSATGTDAASAMVNQNGWNWVDHPGKVSEKTFKCMIYAFQYSNGYFYPGSSAMKSGAIQTLR